MRASCCWPSRIERVVGNYGRYFSSLSELAYFRDKPEEKENTYDRALKHQRPATVDADGRNTLLNFVSFIGTIRWPLKPCKGERFGVYTLLDIESKSRRGAGFSVLLTFWDETGEMSLEHLKPLDTVYVSGHLTSYVKEDDHKKSIQNFQVVVKEVNFVAQHGKPKVSFEERVRRRGDRLRLWQVFFASPDEWWDNRNCKSNPSTPDFVHKDTREALWLMHADPPWIREQLQVIDSRLGNSSGDRRNSWSQLLPLVYDR